MELIRKTHIDFLGKRHICFGLSVLLLAVSAWSLYGGINRGIDFAGGTEIQVKFAQPPAIDEIRSRLGVQNLGDVDIQSIGQPEDGEFIIRVGSQQDAGTASAQELDIPAADTVGEAEDGTMPAAQEMAEADPEAVGAPPAEANELEAVAPLDADDRSAPRQGEQARVYRAVLSVLHDITGVTAEDSSRLDLNVANVYEIVSMLNRRDPAATDNGALGQAIADYRRDHAGLFRSYAELDEVEGMTADIRSYLETEAVLGPFTIRRVEFVGPRVGSELAQKAYLAMVFALAGMLVYITVRFRKLGFALGGILALVHDGVLAAGVFNLWGGQFDLTIVAAILTLLGYSINDTIVIFDRVRENMRTMRGQSDMDIFNASINQTLSRTLLTSMTTLLVVTCLFVFGGETIHGFAFVLLFGVVVGTYSTIFIASPVVLTYNRWLEGRRSAGHTHLAPVSPGKASRRQGKPPAADKQ